jgi:hypothetical protein
MLGEATRKVEYFLDASALAWHRGAFRTRLRRGWSCRYGAQFGKSTLERCAGHCLNSRKNLKTFGRYEQRRPIDEDSQVDRGLRYVGSAGKLSGVLLQQLAKIERLMQAGRHREDYPADEPTGF